MAEHDDDSDGKTVRRQPLAPPVDSDIGFETTTVRGSVPRAAEPVLEHTVVRRVTSDVDPLIGAMLGEYRVLAPLGTGGMGLVYRGEQPVIGRPVAIKVLKREFAQDPAHARRFLEEARSVSAARHPGIIDIFSFGETLAGEPYLVMELLEGEPLDGLLARRGALPPKEAIALLIPMLNALSAAHAAGVIHRDLKPGNIFVVKLADGTTFPKLLDFGLARRGEAGSSVRQTSVGGTPLYIAPEQARGEAVRPQTDLYSFGCVVYEMLTGKPPFTAVNLHELLDQHHTLAPKPLRPLAPAVSVELERLVLSLLEKDPLQRPASALEVREQLERLQQTRAPRAPATLAARPTSSSTEAPFKSREEAPFKSSEEAPFKSSEEAPFKSSEEAPFKSSEEAPFTSSEVETRPSTPRRVSGLVPHEANQTSLELPVTSPARAKWPLVVALTVGVVLVAGAAVVLRPAPVVVAPPPLAPTVVVAPEVPKPEALPQPAEPEPEPESVVAEVEKPEKVAAKPRHTTRDVLQKLRSLRVRSRSLPEDLRRAAKLELDEAGFCRATPDRCWRDLAAIEKTYFPK